MELYEDCTINAQKLIHPELLSRNELHEILLSRCVQKQHLEGLEKVQLVDLFQRIVMPLPQRIYNDKRRGKMLNQMRSKKESLGKIKTGDSCINLTASQSSNMKNMSFESKMENKDTKNSLDHIIINDRRKIPRIDKESPKGCDSLKDDSLTTDCSKSKTNTVVKMKRRDTNSSEYSSTSANEDEEEGKKKKRRIVWP